MSHEVIKKAKGEAASAVLTKEASTVKDQIRDRAFHIFVDHGKEDGYDLDHWFQAEQDLMQVPEGHLIEKHESFELQVAVPGFDEKDVTVTALPNALIVSAASKHKHSNKTAGFHSRSFGEKRMFKRFDLPASIDSDKVHAKLENGLLKIIAHTLESSSPVTVSVSTA